MAREKISRIQLTINLVPSTYLIWMLADIFSNYFGDSRSPISRPNDTNFLLTRHFIFCFIHFVLFEIRQTLNLLRLENVIKWDKSRNVNKCVNPSLKVSKQSHTPLGNININFEWHSPNTNVTIDILSQRTNCFCQLMFTNA